MPDSCIVNSFKAHQLLDFALTHGKQQPLKLALFDAHFGEGRNVSDSEVLLDIAEQVGLDRAAASEALHSGAHEARVREQEAFWTSHGITGVPSMIFGGTFLITGAQGTENYARILRKTAQEVA